MDLCGHAMDLFGHEVRTDGHAMDLFGQAIDLFGHEIRTHGHAMDLFGHTMDLFGHEVRAEGHAMDLFGHTMDLFGHAVLTEGHARVLFSTSGAWENTSERQFRSPLGFRRLSPRPPEIPAAASRSRPRFGSAGGVPARRASSIQIPRSNRRAHRDGPRMALRHSSRSTAGSSNGLLSRPAAAPCGTVAVVMSPGRPAPPGAKEGFCWAGGERRLLVVGRI
jgi:hypothetical protein